MHGRGLHLFRWTTSPWGCARPLAGASPTGLGAVDGGVERDWNSQNLLIEFGKHDLHRSNHFLEDSEFFSALLEWALRNAPAWPDEPVQIAAGHRHAGTGDHHPSHAILTPGSFEFAEVGQASHNFKVARQDLLRVSYAEKHSRGKLESSCIRYTLHFPQKTKAGWKMTLRFDGQSMLMVAHISALPPALQ